MTRPECNRSLANEEHKQDAPLNGNVRTDELFGHDSLDRRLGDRATVKREVAAWVRDRNGATRAIAWRFTDADARIKLRRLYPAHDD